MGFLVFLLIVFGIPSLEIYVMIEIGSEIGALATVGLILLTAAIGGLLFRVQGIGTLRRVQAHLERDEMPVGELLSGVGILLAALLLFIPGFVTDALGFLLFIPPLRFLVMAMLLGRVIRSDGMRSRMAGFSGGPHASHGASASRGGPSGRGPVIDGDFEDLTPEERANSQSDASRPEGRSDPEILPPNDTNPPNRRTPD
jgi:UPF0716 protein FxsA